jgi:hypothetical protein
MNSNVAYTKKFNNRQTVRVEWVVEIKLSIETRHKGHVNPYSFCVSHRFKHNL